MSVYKISILLVCNRECMEHNVRESFRILSSFECFLRYFQTEWSVFLPFSVNCSQVAMFQIMPALCPHEQRESGDVVSEMLTDLDRARKGPKNSQICADILYGWPLRVAF